MEHKSNIDNSDSLEAQRIRCESEYIKCVEDFARYVQKEYINDGERSLVIAACERIESAGMTPACHIMMGSEELVIKSMASMMETEEMGETMTHAYLTAIGMEPTESMLKDKRRQLRTFYIIAVLSVLWTLFLIGLWLWDVAYLTSTICNLLLMAFIGVQLWMPIHTLRRSIRKLEQTHEQERQHCRAHAMNAAAQALSQLAQKLRDAMHSDEDDDEEE